MPLLTYFYCYFLRWKKSKTIPDNLRKHFLGGLNHSLICVLFALQSSSSGRTSIPISWSLTSGPADTPELVLFQGQDKNFKGSEYSSRELYIGCGTLLMRTVRLYCLLGVPTIPCCAILSAFLAPMGMAMGLPGDSENWAVAEERSLTKKSFHYC